MSGALAPHQTDGPDAPLALGVDFAPPCVGEALAEARADDLWAQIQLEAIGLLADPRRHRPLPSLQFVGKEAREITFDSGGKPHAGLVSTVQTKRSVSRIGSP